MLRTNSKKAKENIRAYIMQDLDYIQERAEYNGKEINGEDFEAVAVEIYKAFIEEHWNNYNIKQYYKHNIYASFTDWAQGLAMGGLFLYYYNVSAVKILGDILEETEEERSKHTEEQAESLLTRLIYREITDAVLKVYRR